MAAPPDDSDRTSARPAGSSPDDPARRYPFLSPPDAALPDDLGRLGPYRVVTLLGEGGMGFVFRGEDDALGRPVALKVMRPEVAAQPTARDRFLREGRAAAAVRSDHVITIYQVGEANGVPFLAMEFLDGQTLADWLQAWRQANRRPARPAMILSVARHLLRGLVAAHAKGLIHRDIKPPNLWLESGTNRLKLLDFGLARDGPTSALTLSGAILGTAAYMAPEQARGKTVDPRTDLFSVGVVLHELLAGQSPFRRETYNETIIAVVMDPAPPAASFGPLPPGLAALIDRLLEKSPDARPASAAAALAEVTRIEQELRGKGTTPAEGAAKSSPAPPVGPKAGEERRVAIPGGLEMRFTWCPPGNFLMGGNGVADNPQHQVTIGKDFWMGKFPVTQAEWQTVMGHNPSHFRGDDRPVENVSWDDAQEFCQKMTQLVGMPIRLPTEAEWEYACRAGTTSEYWNGNGVDAIKKAGWFKGNSGKQSKPVGKLAANPWGLHDVHGNVWEWCQDWYGALTAENRTDPTESSTGKDRVIRGGCWSYSPAYCLAACRSWGAPGYRLTVIGLRVCFRLDG